MRNAVFALGIVILLGAGCVPSIGREVSDIPTDPESVAEVQADNIFSEDIQQGDIVVAFTATEVSSTPNSVSVTFSGTVLLEGELDVADSVFIPDSAISIINLTTASDARLPRLAADNRDTWFVAENFAIPEGIQDGDRVVVTIREYKYRFAPKEVWNAAEIVSMEKVK